MSSRFVGHYFTFLSHIVHLNDVIVVRDALGMGGVANNVVVIVVVTHERGRRVVTAIRTTAVITGIIGVGSKTRTNMASVSCCCCCGRC